MTRTILLIVFGLFAVYGFFQSGRSIRKIRAPRRYKNALFTWAERPRSGYKYELNSWIATSVHWIAVIALGLGVLIMLVNHPITNLKLPGLPDPVATLLAMPILWCIIGGTGFLWGLALFGPIAESIGGDCHFAMAEEGLLDGGYLFPWSTFSHASFDTEQNVVRIWSKSYTGIVCFALAPPAPEIMLKLVGFLQSHLPSSETSSKSFIASFAFPALMAGASFLIVMLAFLTYLLPIGIALILNSFFMYVLISLGAKLIMHYAFGGKAQPAPLE